MALLTLLATAAPLAAQCELTRLRAEDAVLGADSFASAMAYDGDRLVIGAYANAVNGFSNAGAAYVFVRSNGQWQQEAKLTAPVPAANSYFASRVAISGDRIAVRSGNEVSGPDAVYVFQRSGATWLLDATISSPVPWLEPQTIFGYAVSLHGDRLAVSSTQEGAVYVYRHDGTGWIQEQRITESGSGSHFGNHVDIEDDRLVVSVSATSTIYVYDRIDSIWQQQAALPRSGMAVDGDGLSLSGDMLVAAAPSAPTGTPNSSGLFTVFKRSNGNWAATSSVISPMGKESSPFATHVSVLGDHLVARGKDFAYAYEQSGGQWTLSGRLVPASPAWSIGSVVAGDNFLAAVDPAGFADPPIRVAGVLIFDPPVGPDCNSNLMSDGCELVAGYQQDCNVNTIPDDCDIATAMSEDCTANGVPDECESDCNLNSVADSCDIGNGASTDCNANAVPDECDTPFECVSLEPCKLDEVTTPNALNLGQVVSLHGDWAVITAIGNDWTKGRAFTYKRFGTEWSYIAEINPPEQGFFYYGYCADLSDDRAVVSGFVFSRNGNAWSYEAQLGNLGPASECSIAGNVAVVCHGTTSSACDANTLRVYRRSGGQWQLDGALDVAAAKVHSLDNDGDTVVVGGRSEGQAGQVFVFAYANGVWALDQVLDDPNGTYLVPPHNQLQLECDFGRSVAVRGDWILVGAPNWWGIDKPGSAFVYRRTSPGWVLHDELNSAVGLPGDRAGVHVAIEGRKAIIAAGDTTSSFAAAHVFTLDPTNHYWIETATFPPAPESIAYGAVAISGSVAVVGERGKATFYAVGGDCNGNGAADFCDIQSQASPDEDDDGIPDDCPDCDFNGLVDASEIADGLADCDGDDVPDACEPDCNGNGVADFCDVASGFSLDADDNGIPDECPILLLSAEPAGFPKNRFLSFVIDPTSAGQLTAIRVQMAELDHFRSATLAGSYRYVNTFADADGQPVFDCPDSIVHGTSYKCARLGCQPVYRDWAADLNGAVLHVTGQEAVPGSLFTVNQLASACAGLEENCGIRSVALNLMTAAWGGIVNGAQPTVIDVGKMVDKVKGLPVEITEPQALLQPAIPDPLAKGVDVRDIGSVVDGIKGLPYGNDVLPCP